MVDDLSAFQKAARQLDAFLRPESGARQARTRERILGAACELFVAYGYRKTSVEDVAASAGVAKGTIYLYYRNKAELLLHAIALQKQQYMDELAPAFEVNRSPVERLRLMIRLGIEISHRMPLMNRTLAGDHEFEQALAEVDERTLSEINALQVGSVADLIDEATDRSWSREDLEARAAVLVDLMFAVVNGGRLIRSGISLEHHADSVADVIVRGLVARPDVGEDVGQDTRSTE